MVSHTFLPLPYSHALNTIDYLHHMTRLFTPSSIRGRPTTFFPIKTIIPTSFLFLP